MQESGSPCSQTGCVAARPAAPRLPVRAERARVHGPEARRRQGHEHRRVPAHGVRDALAAPQAGADQVVGVLAVALRARRADRLAPVPARLAEHAVGLGLGRPHALDAVARRRSRSCPAAGPGARSYPEERSCASKASKSGRAARSISPPSSSGVSPGTPRCWRSGSRRRSSAAAVTDDVDLARADAEHGRGLARVDARRDGQDRAHQPAGDRLLLTAGARPVADRAQRAALSRVPAPLLVARSVETGVASRHVASGCGSWPRAAAIRMCSSATRSRQPASVCGRGRCASSCEGRQKY